jgi:hypothetical protein
MSSAADKIRAAAARQAPAAPPAEPEPGKGTTERGPARTPAAGQSAPRERDVRCTVDLSPVAFRELRDWRNETADLSGRSRVTNQDVLAALVDLLLTDESIAGQVRAKLPDTASGSKAANR